MTFDSILEKYYQKYKIHYRVQAFYAEPRPWVNYKTPEYDYYINAYKEPNHREIMPDEVVLDIDVSKSLSISEQKLEGKKLMTLLQEKLKSLTIGYSVWNSGGSGYHCLRSKEKVIVRINNKIKLIELRQLISLHHSNESVYIKTKEGFKKVLNVVEREQTPNEKLCKIKLNGMNGVICSKDHRFPVVRNEEYMILEAEDIKLNDKMLLDISGYNGDETKGSYDLGRFIGLYLAEGNKHKTKPQVYFCFDKSEMDYALFIKEFCEKNYCAKVTIKEIKNYIRVFVYSKTIYNLLDDFVIGNNSRSKNFKGKVYNACNDFRTGIIDGWLEGDGLHRQYQNGCTISKGLAKSIQSLGLSVGRLFTINQYKKAGTVAYNLHWIKKPKQEYKTYLNPPKNCVYAKVTYKSNNFIKKTRLVDIEIDSEDHLFTLSNGIVTHNCHMFFPKLMDYPKYERTELKRMIIKHLGYGYLTGKAHVCMGGGTLIQIEERWSRKGNQKTHIATVGDFESNKIPDAVLKKYQEQKEAMKHRKPVVFHCNDKPSCIKFFESEDFISTNDGWNRASFILAAFYRDTGKNKEETLDALMDWNEYTLSRRIHEKQIRSTVNSVFRNKRKMTCRYRKQLLEDLGQQILCKGCKHNV